MKDLFHYVQKIDGEYYRWIFTPHKNSYVVFLTPILQNVILFENRGIADVICYDEVTLK